jgi:hypothetical protein
MPNASTANDSATMLSSGRMWPPCRDPSVSVHSPWQWKNGAVAFAERHRAELQPRDAGGGKRAL